MRLQAYVGRAWLALVVSFLVSASCVPKANLSLVMERTEVVAPPMIESLDVEPRGEVDTTDTSRTIKVVMMGDPSPSLEASLDIEGIPALARSDRPMAPTSPGVFEDSFEVPKGSVGAVSVIARLKDPVSGGTEPKRRSIRC